MIKGPLVFAQYTLEAYDRIFNEIKDAINKQRDKQMNVLKVTNYPPKVLLKLSEEFQAEGYGVSIHAPRNAKYVEMWLTWGGHYYSGE